MMTYRSESAVKAVSYIGGSISMMVGYWIGQLHLWY